MYQNVCLARFGRLRLLCCDLRSTWRCLQQYSLGQCHLDRRQLAGRNPSLAECQDPSSTVPRVRSFACGQALSEEVAFSSRQRTTGSRLHGFPFVHDDHHQGQSLLILFCLFLPFLVLGCFLSLVKKESRMKWKRMSCAVTYNGGGRVEAGIGSENFCESEYRKY